MVTGRCPRGVMFKSAGLRNHSKQVRTSVMLLCSLSDKYPCEGMKPLILPAMG